MRYWGDEAPPYSTEWTTLSDEEIDLPERAVEGMEALGEINDAYVEVAQAHDLNLETHRYEYDPTRKALVLTQVALHGKVR